ncbi:MAG: extracellular solute-binding protein [Deltaproteobacteria bacterium]|nr:extracellular solute-binding protein [Deltaproteobacteria bacterium]MBI4373628.1 extracellular solute-binding protein [Deltaproteobacteria bacterium]
MFKRSPLFFFLAIIVFSSLHLSCARKKGETIWIYASVYPETVEIYDRALKQKFPGLEIKWFQNGSENLAAKLALEEIAGDIKADLVLLADIFWCRRKAVEGFWEPYQPRLDYDVPDAMEGPGGTFTTPRISVMVIGYNKKFLTEEEAPKSFKELIEPKWKGRVSSGSPLESGTNFTLMLNFAYRYGYDFLKKLRENEMISAGGNSAVSKRIVMGERPVGLILEESMLFDMRKNPNLGIIYPSDGVIITPGPMGIPRTSRHKETSKKIYDFLMSEEGQKITIQGFLHVPNPKVGTPPGARPFAELQQNSFELSEAFFEFAEREKDFKDKFADIMLK